MDVTSIRIDSTLLETHQGKVVRIIGKLESYDPSSQQGTLTSNGQIQINLSQMLDEPVTVNKIYEVVGKVSTSNLQVNVLSILELSDNTNLDVASKLAQYVRQVPELYYD